MLDADLIQHVAPFGSDVAALQGVDEFGQYRRRRQCAVVAHVAPHVAEVQHLTHGEQRFEEGMAIFFAIGPVARARMTYGEIEIRHGRVARKLAVVEPQQAQHRHRHRAMGPQGGEGDAATKEGPAGRHGLQCVVEAALHHGEGHGFIAGGLGGGIAHGLPGGAQGLGFRGRFRIVEVEEVLQQALEKRRPFRWRACPSKGGVGGEQRLAEADEAPQHTGAAALDGCSRQTPLEQGRGEGGRSGHAGGIDFRQGHAEQQALEALAPAMGVFGGQVAGCAPGAVDAPADAGGLHPEAQLFDVVPIEAPAPCHGRVFEEGQHLLGFQPPLGDIEQGGEGAQQRGFDRGRAIRNGEGQAQGRQRLALPRPLPLQAGAEAGLDQRRIGFEIGGEHQHVRRAQLGAGFEQGEQPVVEHIHLAHGAVADVDLQAVVIGGNHLRRHLRQIVQIEHVGLQGAQHGCGRDILEGGDFRIDLFADAIEKLPRHRAEGAEHRMAGFEQHGRPWRFQRRPGAHAGSDQIAPVGAAGVEQIQGDVDVAAQFTENFEHIGRHGADAEEADAPRQPRREAGVGGQCGEEGIARMHFGQGRHFRHKLAPQLGLPDFVRPEMTETMLRPGGQPVGPIGQVALEGFRQFQGQAVTAAHITVGEKAPQCRKFGLRALQGQQPQQAPVQALDGKRRAGRNIRQHRSEQLPQVAGGKGKAQLGCNAQLFREHQPHPARHGFALDQHHLRLEQGRRIGFQAMGQQTGEQILPVAVDEGEHGAILGGQCAVNLWSIRPQCRQGEHADGHDQAEHGGVDIQHR